MPRRAALGAVLAVAVLILAGCATTIPSDALKLSADSLARRQLQTRKFTGITERDMLAASAGVLQDLSFVVDKADETLGTVSATKLSGYQLRMTVTVRPCGEKQLLVRASAEYKERAVEDPLPYQDFFAALEKAMFLTAHQVD